MTAHFILFFETFKLCRRIVRHGLTAQFDHIPALKTPLNLLALYVQPLRDLPKNSAERLLGAAKETDAVYFSYMRFAAAFPETAGLENVLFYAQAPRLPLSASKQEIARTVAQDFPSVKKEFFDGVVPQMILSPERAAQFAHQTEIIRRIVKKSVKLAWDQNALNRFEDFCKHVSRADMRLAAADLEEHRKAFADADYVFVPEVDWMRTSKNLLVCKPYEKSEFLPTLTSKDSIVRTIPEMVLRHGFFSLPSETPLEMTYREKLILNGSLFSFRLKGKERVFLYDVLQGLADKNFDAVAMAFIRAGMTNGTFPVFALAQTCKNLYQSGEKLSAGERLGAAIDTLSKKGVAFSPALRAVFTLVLSYEAICDDRQLWDACTPAHLLSEHYRVEPPETEQSEAEQTDTVQEMRDRLLTVPPVAEGLQAVNAAKKAAFVKNPEWIAKTLKKAQEE